MSVCGICGRPSSTSLARHLPETHEIISIRTFVDRTDSRLLTKRLLTATTIGLGVLDTTPSITVRVKTPQAMLSAA